MTNHHSLGNDQSGGRKALVLSLSAIFIILSFLPYVAVSLGNSTNVSAAALVGTILTVRLLRRPWLLILFLISFSLPLTATLFRLFATDAQVNANGYITYAITLFTFFGAISAIDTLRSRSIAVVGICISASALLAIVQKYLFLDNGVVPFVQFYNVSGYASVAANADTIARYIRRPFGLFPEPSFLAGTLALACGALVILSAHYRVPLKAPAIATLCLAVFTIYISDSGSGIICIGILALSVMWPSIRKNNALILVLPIVMAGAVWLGLSIASGRQDGLNTSWNDRYASLVGAFNLWTADVVPFLVGVGRGMVPAFFKQGDVDFGGISTYSAIPDVYSVLGRIVVENGLLFGGPIIAWMFILIIRLGSSRIHVLGALMGALWCVVAGLTISYETAVWIWIVPALCLAFRLSPSGSTTDMNGKVVEDSSYR